jgi:ribose 1,5-bisphosphokinase
MSRGTFVAVVGPSGSGKDTLIREALARRPDLLAARRVVSRPAHDATERFESVTAVEFARRRDAGGFALQWQAHGLDYGIPATVEQALGAGRHVLANLSRAAVMSARARFSPFRALLVTAPAEVLARRLAARGREDAGAIRARLERAAHVLPPGAGVTVIENGGALEESLPCFLAALPPQPVRA